MAFTFSWKNKAMHELMWIIISKRVRVKKYRHVVGLLGRTKDSLESGDYEFKLEPDGGSESC